LLVDSVVFEAVNTEITAHYLGCRKYSSTGLLLE